jgi:hypothetical protein
MSINVVNVGNIPASVYFTNQTNSMVNTIWTPTASTIGGTYVQIRTDTKENESQSHRT